MSFILPFDLEFYPRVLKIYDSWVILHNFYKNGFDRTNKKRGNKNYVQHA